jgi:hypothetical protein
MGTEPPYYSSDLSDLHRLIVFQHQRRQHDRSACLAEGVRVGERHRRHQRSAATVLCCNETCTNGKTRSEMVREVSVRKTYQGAHEDRGTKHCHCLPCISPPLTPSAHNNRITVCSSLMQVIRGAAILTPPVGKVK